MNVPLLQSKLYIPRPRENLVSRPHLLEKLNEGLGRKLTLVAAPAGFGKSSLLSEWVNGVDHPVVWLSLDKKDDDLARFFVYFIATIQGIKPDFSLNLTAALQAAQIPPVEILLTMLMNEIEAIDRSFTLVLDDYHLITVSAIHEALSYLLEHLPHQMHVVIASRADPFLPLSLLRGRGQMVELRSDDLRFSVEETIEFLNQIRNLGLSEKDIRTLETRTEGWIAGLHLAALSMHGKTDRSSFISELTGDDRYIVDFLVDEVLTQRPKGTNDFLLQTSILERMTGSLCDAVTGQQTGKEILTTLDQANMFIVPLDNQRRWYRYHRLFADLLRLRLSESASLDEVNTLHRRASEWFESTNSLIEAVDHAFAGADYENAVRLIYKATSMLFETSQLPTFQRWWEKLPEAIVLTEPKLGIIVSWAWLATSQPGESEKCLEIVERALGTDMSVLFTKDDLESSVPAETLGALIEITVIRGQLSLIRGDIPNALKLSNLILPYLEDDEGPFLFNQIKDSRAVMYFNLGVAYQLNGELKASEKALLEACTLAEERKNAHLIVVALGHLARIQSDWGQLSKAIRTCERGLLLVDQILGYRTPLTGLLLTELGNLHYEQNDLARAEQYLQEGITLAKPWTHIETLLPGFIGLARLKKSQGDLAEALGALDELTALCVNSPAAVTTHVEPCRAKFSIEQGEVEKAVEWVRAAGIEPDMEIDHQREGEFITLARVLMAREKWDEASDLIHRLLDRVESNKRWGLTIELLALQTLVLDRMGEQDQAMEMLAQALTLAEPRGYIRTLIDEGTKMAALLRQAASAGILPDYVSKLLVALKGDKGEISKFRHPAAHPDSPSLIEPLSERELEVLRLLNTELSGPEIAHELTVALSTMRSHTQSIYAKLNVTSRRAALRKAKELELI